MLTTVDGAEKTTDLPMRPQEFGAVKKIALTGPAWTGAVEITLDPPLEVNGDGELRIKLAAQTLKAGSTQARLAWSFPAGASLLLKDSDFMNMPRRSPRPTGFPTRRPGTWASAIGTEDWLDKPAGKHGGVRLRGDRFVFEDGTPIRFWGTNLSYGASASPKADAEFTAARFAKFGRD